MLEVALVVEVVGELVADTSAMVVIGQDRKK
jgi:hypothetical protein